MNLVMIFGPQAVGKMTVGHELEKITDLKLFHNHMTIELVDPFISYSTPEGKRLVKMFRDEILKVVAEGNSPGIIHTNICDFNDENDWQRIEEISNLFSENGARVCLVELEADVETRVERNKTDHRLLHKPSKRDLVWSESELRTTAKTLRLNSHEGEIKNPNYIRINNSELSPGKVALMIKERFSL